MITHNNYEAYLLDYFEDKLSHELVEELLAFIDANEDIKQAIGELSAPGELILDAPQASFPNKKSLKKQELINDDNYLEYLVALVENDLNLSERKEVRSYIALNPQMQKEFALLQQTRLDSADIIAYPNKSKLKKGGLIVPLYYPIAAAASLILLFGVYYIYKNANTINTIAKEESSNPAHIDTLNKIQPLLNSAQPVIALSKTVVKKQNNAGNKSVIPRETIAFANIIAVETIQKPVAEQAALQYIEVPLSNQKTDIAFTNESEEYLSLREKATKKFEKIIDKTDVTAFIDSAKNSGLLNIANAGLNTIGRITGTNLKIERKTDANGDYKGITFAAAGLELTHTKGK